VLSKIGQIESAEATQYLTSALKGFDIEAEKSIEIVDKLAAIDLISATNASGLAEALSRTAASASMTGVEMEQLLGYVAVVGETTQKSMSQVGESKIEYALKTA
jgi:TP901 family phage tail tape measure protein